MKKHPIKFLKDFFFFNFYCCNFTQIHIYNKSQTKKKKLKIKCM